MAENWSVEEVEAIVADYLSMLESELRGDDFNKSAHRSRLRSLLRNRSEGSIERKHQNISAILCELRVPWIIGYKPLHNYQQLLAEVVVDRWESASVLHELALLAVERPIENLPRSSIAFENPPEGNRRDHVREAQSLAEWLNKARIIDYFARETRNQSFGTAGENLVVGIERKRLLSADAEQLANKVQRISTTRGDGTGFDVLSYEPNGSQKFIEVKTASFVKETPFHVSRSEVHFSADFADQYRLYRLSPSATHGDSQARRRVRARDPAASSSPLRLV